MIEGYIKELKETLDGISREKLKGLVGRIINTDENGKKIYLIGNGGSASTASHWACDLGKGTLNRFYDPNQRRLRVVSLTDNMPIITCLANDLTYDEIFSQQLRNLIEKNDLLITLSGSGNSKNVINAVDVAKKKGAYVFSLLGFDGGEVAHMSDDSIIIPSRNYGIIEDVHLTLGHLVTMSIKKGNNFVAEHK